jgi:hydroxypyruvate reductase
VTDRSLGWRGHAVAIFEAAVAGVEPGTALGRALATTPPPERVRIFALGKASTAMVTAAAAHLDRLEIPITGGLAVTSLDRPRADRRIDQVIGDHPLPGDRSHQAAVALAASAELTNHREEVWVLLSGGTTSLIGAPADQLDPGDYRALMAELYRAGLPIGTLNRLRKRFSRFGGGRLAAACRAERIRVFAISDVAGDAPGDIGSGPCEADQTTAVEIRDLLHRLPIAVPEGASRWLDRVIAGELAETPKPDHPALTRVVTRIVGSNRDAVAAAGVGASGLGYRVILDPAPLAGEAHLVGSALARSVLEARIDEPHAWIWGGETIVTVGANQGRGGRCQELALAAARELGRSGRPHPIILLAAGTDGRDGPTDAAGAIVDEETWRRIGETGIDPVRSLAGHDAYPALDRVGALYRPGPTGTNVMDIVVALAIPGESR